MLEDVKPPKMATIKEVAEITGLARHYVRQLALQNKVSHVRAGKKILINVEKRIDELIKIINQNYQGQVHLQLKKQIQQVNLQQLKINRFQFSKIMKIILIERNLNFQAITNFPKNILRNYQN